MATSTKSRKRPKKSAAVDSRTLDNNTDRYAVFQASPPQVVARMLYREEAAAFAKSWSKRHGKSVIVKERYSLMPVREISAKAGIFNVVVLNMISQAVHEIAHQGVDRFFARGYCRGFNCDEQQAASGLWAVAVPVYVAMKEGGAA